MAYIKLEQAAEMLGLTPDQLNEHRENYDIKGYRDGASWKFQEEEVERFAQKLGTDVSAVSESLSGVDLPSPSSNEPSIDIDSELDEMISLEDSDDSEDTEGPDSVLVSEQSLGGSDSSASSTIIGKDEGAVDDGDLALSLDDNESSEELVLDLDDEAPLLGEAADSAELKLEDSGELKLEDSGEINLDGGSELKLDDGSELTLGGDSGDLVLSEESGVAAKSDMELADMGSAIELGAEESAGDSPTTGSGLELAADSAVGEAAAAAVGGAAMSDDDSGELVLQADSGLLASDDSAKKIQESDDLVLDTDGIEISDDSIDLDGDDLVLEGGSAIDLGGSSLNLDGSGTGIGLSGIDSDVTINAGDSGISLTSPSDSGISLGRYSDGTRRWLGY